jgi:hypothetical protein
LSLILQFNTNKKWGFLFFSPKDVSEKAIRNTEAKPNPQINAIGCKENSMSIE